MIIFWIEDKLDYKPQESNQDPKTLGSKNLFSDYVTFPINWYVFVFKIEINLKLWSHMLR